MGHGDGTAVPAVVDGVVHGRHRHRLRLVPVVRREGQAGGRDGGNGRVGAGDADGHVGRRLAVQHHRVGPLVLLVVRGLAVVRLGQAQGPARHRHPLRVVVGDRAGGRARALGGRHRRVGECPKRDRDGLVALADHVALDGHDDVGFGLPGGDLDGEWIRQGVVGGGGRRAAERERHRDRPPARRRQAHRERHVRGR